MGKDGGQRGRFADSYLVVFKLEDRRSGDSLDMWEARMEIDAHSPLPSFL